MIPLEKERAKLEKKIKAKESEFKQLERNIIALRSGKFVIRSGQSIIISEITSSNKDEVKSQIAEIIMNANKYTYKIVKPKSKEVKNILLLRKNHIEEMQKTILEGGNWVVNIKSVRNVLTGENFVYAFPELTENKVIVRKGEKITKVDFKLENFNKKDFGNKLNFLLSSSLAEVKRRGSLTNEIKLRSDSVNELRDFLNKNDKTNFELEAVSLSDSMTIQPVAVELKINYPQS